MQVRIISGKQAEFTERLEKQQHALRVEAGKIRDNAKTLAAKRAKFAKEAGPGGAWAVPLNVCNKP